MSEKEAVVINQTSAPKLPDGVLDPSRVTKEEFTGCTVYAMYNGPTDMLSAVSTGMAVLDPGGIPHPPHQHPEEEFMIVASGTGEIEVDGKVTQVGPGAIMYTAGNTMHGIKNTGAAPMTFYWSKWTAKGA
ncbi:MAG: cupin domain-containing protein [Gemmatimonadetes bacterium]|nr:cupin domain-containing protein [Gemmatimonadota bacterium]